MITDVATTVPTADNQALPGIHARLAHRGLLPTSTWWTVAIPLAGSTTR